MDTERLGGKDIFPDDMRISLWSGKLSGSREKKMAYSSTSMSKIVPCIKMP